LPQRLGSGEEGRRAADRGRPLHPRPALTHAGHRARQANRRPRGEDRRPGRSARRGAGQARRPRGQEGAWMIGITIADIQVGNSAQVGRRRPEEDIAAFVEAVGNYNPIHADPEYAATTIFKEPIAPGIWTAGLISAVIGTRLPGPGAIYLSQELKFLKPVLFGDVIMARAEVIEVMRERNRLRLRTVCTNQRGDDVLTGGGRPLPSHPRAPRRGRT